MLDIQNIVSTAVTLSLLLLFYIHIFYKERMREANLVFATIAVLLFGTGVLLMTWNPFGLKEFDTIILAVLAIGVAAGFVYAAYKFDAGNKNDTEKQQTTLPRKINDDTYANNSFGNKTNSQNPVSTNVVINTENFIANAQVNSTTIDVHTTETHNSVSLSSTSTENSTVVNNNTTNETINNTTVNHINNSAAASDSINEEDTSDNAYNTENQDKPVSNKEDARNAEDSQTDYMSSKNDVEKEFIKKYVKLEYRNRPVIEAFTRYFETYRSSRDKDTFILQAFYSARISTHWLREEPSRADFVKIWGVEYLGGKSAFSEAKKILLSTDDHKVFIIGKKLKECLKDTERMMGIEREV